MSDSFIDDEERRWCEGCFPRTLPPEQTTAYQLGWLAAAIHWRERCARLCESLITRVYLSRDVSEEATLRVRGYQGGIQRCVDEIRALGKEENGG